MKTDVILLDVCTQRDLLIPGGALYRPGADAAREQIYKLFDWAKANRYPVLSTVLRLPRGGGSALSDQPHCVEGTDGERKLSRALIRPYVNLGLRNTTDLQEDLFEQYRQVIIESRQTDLFEHARAERLITELPDVNFVIFGAGLAAGIVQAAVGLRTRGFGVVLAEDASVGLGDEREAMARNRMIAKGVQFAKTREIVVPRPPKRRRADFRVAERAKAR